MFLTKEIKEKLNGYFQKKLGLYDYNKGWLKGDCPSCGEHKFGIHISTDRSNCFKCGYNDKPINIVMKIEKIDSYRELHLILNDLTGIKFYEEAIENDDGPKKELILPEGYKNIRFGESRLAKAARRYLKKRGFNITELSLAGFGYGTKDKYFGYIIMPYYQDNKLLYFTTRLFIGSGPKFNNPPAEEYGIGKNSIIYNRDALYIYDRIFLVESITNARTIGDNAIGIGGKVLSSIQFNDIIKSPCSKVIIGLDRDAIQYAIDLAFSLIDYKKVKIMIMPHEKDINDLGKTKSLLISYRASYLSYKKLQILKETFRDEHKS